MIQPQTPFQLAIGPSQNQVEYASDTPSIISSAVATGLVFLCTLPAALSLWKRLSGSPAAKKRDAKLYEDEDGKASEKSQQDAAGFLARLAALVVSIAGLLVALMYAILVTGHWSHGGRAPYSWIFVGAWALILSQSIAIFTERAFVLRYNLGLLAALSCLLVGVAVFLEHQPGVIRSVRTDAILASLAYIQGGLLLVDFLALLLIPRRPHVFKDGRIVDGQFTASALSKLWFGWASAPLAYARSHKNLEVNDLPQLSGYQRAEVMEAAFGVMDSGRRLWKTLLIMYWSPFLKQTILVTVLGVSQFGPQLAMFKLLEILQARGAGPDFSLESWAWVFGLGASMMVSTILESWLYYYVWADIGMPVRSLLSILVFSKATRRKDVKGAEEAVEATALAEQVSKAQKGKAPEQTGDDDGTLAAGKKDGLDKKEATDKEEEEDTAATTRQATVNLVGVDAKRVSDFVSFTYLYPGVVVKLVVSLTFLARLIGWKSLLAGLAAFAFSMPFNIILSKWYNGWQKTLMTSRDKKVAVINEALQGIRQIKFSAIEKQWEEKINEKRHTELHAQRMAFVVDTGLVSIWIFGPVMLSAVCLTVYTILNGELSPSIAFTTIAVLAQIEVTLAIIPELTADALDAWVAMNRIEKYLRAPERVKTSEHGDSIRFEDATVAWPADEEDEESSDRFRLKGISIQFPKKELSVISGKTGSGKSLLLAAIIGEIDKLGGTIFIPKAPLPEERHDHKAMPGNWIIDSSIAFVAQIPWIENATIRDNILFGLPYDQGRYRKVLSVCALEKDLEILPDGDMTDIGANGINLSGGQRWRVSFARAMYSRAGILVLDDIFSAVDAHVGRHLFEEALTGELGTGRTRILVTHHVGLCLPRTKYSVHLGDGTVQLAGFVADLQRQGRMAEILRQEEKAISRTEDEDEGEASEPNGDANGTANGDGGALTKMQSRHSVRSERIDDGGLDAKAKSKPKKFTEDEKRETGRIKLDVYWWYIQSGGGLVIWIPLVLTYLVGSGATLLKSYWVTIWTRSYSTEPLHVFGPYYHSLLQLPASNNATAEYSTQATSSSHTVWYWLGIYLALSVFVWVFGTLKYFMSFVASLKSSRKLHDQMTHIILRTPLRWLDTVPIGRILNRFSSDFNVIDSRIAPNMGYFFYQALEMVTITVAGFIASPIMIPFALALLGAAFLVMRLYLGGAREIKRLESNARSPIFSDFGALLSGVATVRAFDKTTTYITRMHDRINTHGSSFYHVWLFNRWMGMRLSVTGTIFAVIMAIIIVASRSIDAALAGFALNFALRYSSSMNWTMRGYSNVEMDLNSAERIIEYTRLDTEDQSGNPAPAAWPTSGRLEVHDLVAGYAPDLPAVLKGLSFSVESGQRVGVVGRTGAGKSSLTLALFRFINQREGSVFVDGLDVSKIRLHDLRSRLAIIPQDPVLFSGTVRSNLDPFDEHSDSELRAALQRVHLVEETGTVSRGSTLVAQESETDVATSSANEASGGTNLPAGSDQPLQTANNKNVFSRLDSKIAEGGLNLSQGQRQLLCLARAIVSRPRLMVLDEATSAVDMGTDELIQRSIREEFEGSTLLVIAHRLSTIADFDKILVMSEGRAVEFDSPRELMKIRDGVFRGMVEGSGERNQLEEIIQGEGSTSLAAAAATTTNISTTWTESRAETTQTETTQTEADSSTQNETSNEDMGLFG